MAKNTSLLDKCQKNLKFF